MMPSKLNVATGLLTLTLMLLSGTAARAQGNEQLTLMTWNIHGGNSEQTVYPAGSTNNNCVVVPANVNPVRQRIALYNSTHAHKIDAIGLQEVHKGQAEELARGLGYPPPVFITTLPCNPSNPKLDYGNAILSPHPMKEYGNYLISTPGVEQRRGELSRIASASVLLPSGRWVRVFNSHLTANPKGNESEHQRELNKQVADVIWVINIDEFFVFHGTRSVFMTDFNTTEGTDAYDHMVNGARGGHFDDAWRKFYPAGTGRTTPALTTHLRFDHIFFDRVSGMRVAGAEVLDICGSAAGSPLKKPNDCISDHRPVVTTLVF